MNTPLMISSWCVLKNNTLNLNNEFILNETSDLASDFVKQLYRSLNISYNKFFKMDSLSRLAFVCTELILQKRKLNEEYSAEEIGVILANQSSSLHTDLAYFESIKNKSEYFPNPSLFVYTLPNIMIGEICIRHGIKGENTFYISEKPDFEFLSQQVNYLFETNVIQCCLCGWVEINTSNQYQATLLLVEKNKMLLNTANFYTFDALNASKIHSLL